MLAVWLLARATWARASVALPDTLPSYTRLAGVFSENLCLMLPAASTRLMLSS